ncbi:MAG TPA: SDR family oxidoreductase [Anaerolineae bacterium]|nr:SDR family oxidoreductase [Anaerolineae bacterium]
MQFEDLKGKIAVVTGASRRQGIGAAICRTLAAQGVDLLFTTWQPYDQDQPHGLDQAGPVTLLAELQQLGIRAARLEIDLSHHEAPQQILQAVEEQLGPPTILINNAAYSTRDGYIQLDAATLDAHYAVNVRAMALLSVEFARNFRGGEHGRIINLTSGQSLGPMPGELAYVATKGAIEAFTRTLAAEIAPLGITVNAVDPGITDTGWMTEEFKTTVVKSMAMGRVGMPEDAARLIVFLASEASGWITGQVLHSRGA